jgi:hypothetical protein
LTSSSLPRLRDLLAPRLGLELPPRLAIRLYARRMGLLLAALGTSAILVSMGFLILPVLLLLPPGFASALLMLPCCAALYAIGASIRYWRQERRAARARAQFIEDAELANAATERGVRLLRERGVSV